MKRKIVSALSMLTCLAACTSPPKPVTPRGFFRVPVNSEAGISQYQMRSVQMETERSEREVYEQQIESLQKRVDDMAAYIARLEDKADSKAGRAKQPIQKKVVNPAAIPVLPLQSSSTAKGSGARP